MEEQEPHSLASTFPNPPPFWKDFTPDRIARIEELRREHRQQNGVLGAEGEAPSTHDSQLPMRLPGGVPKELINLQPPAEPEDRRWRVFGDHYTVSAD